MPFPRVCPKGIVIPLLVFELTYIKVAVQDVNHYTKGTPAIVSSLAKEMSSD